MPATEARIDFPTSLAPQPPGARVITGARPIADAEPVAFQIAFRMQNGAYPPEADYLAVADWLKAQGFTVSGVDPARRMSLDVQGTTAQTSAALRVQFARIEIGGESFVAASTAPSLPAAIGRTVLGINGLQPFLRARKGPHGIIPIVGKPAGR